MPPRLRILSQKELKNNKNINTYNTSKILELLKKKTELKIPISDDGEGNLLYFIFLKIDDNIIIIRINKDHDNIGRSGIVMEGYKLSISFLKEREKKSPVPKDVLVFLDKFLSEIRRAYDPPFHSQWGDDEEEDDEEEDDEEDEEEDDEEDEEEDEEAQTLLDRLIRNLIEKPVFHRDVHSECNY